MWWFYPEGGVGGGQPLGGRQGLGPRVLRVWRSFTKLTLTLCVVAAGQVCKVPLDACTSYMSSGQASGMVTASTGRLKNRGLATRVLETVY